MTQEVFIAYIRIPVSVFLIIVFGLTFAKRTKRSIDFKQAKKGILFMTVSSFVNLIYTGWFGYDHMVANSRLEWTLDILTGITFYYGIFVFLQSVQLLPKKGAELDAKS